MNIQPSMNTIDISSSAIQSLRYTDHSEWKAIYAAWQKEEVRLANILVAPLRTAGFVGRKLRNELRRLRLPAITPCKSQREEYERAYLALNMDLL
jgi:hypothetical protein